MDHKSNRPVFLFYLLAVYVLLQFGWWTYYLIEVNREVRDLSAAFSTDPAHQQELHLSFQNKVWMILGEGSVFVLLLGLGIWQVRKYIKKEAALARLQSNFLLSVTHELKSPLASIKLLFETLIKRELPNEKIKDLSQKGLSETERLNILSDKFLTATRIESAIDVYQSEKIDFSELVRQTSTRLFENSGKHHLLKIEIEKGIYILADAIAIETLLSNLIENAIKYSPPNTEIFVKLKSEGKFANLSVSDKGSGIPINEREKVFRKFYRSGNEEIRKTKGTGLGLYLVRQIALQHQAEILLSDAKPHGSVFTFRCRTL